MASSMTLALEARIPGAIDDALHAAIARHQRQGIGEQGAVVLARRGIHDVHAGEIALSALGRSEAAHASDVERLGAEPRADQFPDEQIQADAMTADDHEIGGLESLSQELYRDRAAGIDDLGVLIDRYEAIRAAERRDRPGAFPHRIRREAVHSLHQPHQQVFGSSTFGVHAHRQRGGDALPVLRRQAGVGAYHGGHELVEREDRGRRKARQDDHRLAAGDRKADRFAGLERHTVSDDTRVDEPAHDPVREIAGPLGRPARENHEVGLQAARERARKRVVVVGDDAQLHRRSPSSSTAAPMIAALES